MCGLQICVLFNATTIANGGGIQAARTFIENVNQINPEGVCFHFCVSRPIFESLNADIKSGLELHVFDERPSGLLSGRKVAKRLKELEAEIQADFVYSFGFPSYVAFSGKEIGRYTNPWEFLDLEEAWQVLNFKERINRKLKNAYRRFWAKKASYFETQTETAKLGIERTFGKNPNQIVVIKNTVNPIFHQKDQQTYISKDQKAKDGHERRIFCLAADHPHKNVRLIPLVAKLVEQDRLNFKFVVTLPESSNTWKQVSKLANQFGVANSIENIGTISLERCFFEYQIADCLFLPTLAEVSSATYLEAMTVGVPILTSKLDFATEACGPAAVYFRPNDAASAASALLQLVGSEGAIDRLVKLGFERVKTQTNSTQELKKFLNWIQHLAEVEQ